MLDLEGAWRRVDGVPETRGGQARRALVQRAQIEVEDAVRQRPAGRHWRRRRRRVSSGGRAWSRRRDCVGRAEGGDEFLRGPKALLWSMLSRAFGLQSDGLRRPNRRPGRQRMSEDEAAAVGRRRTRRLWLACEAAQTGRGQVGRQAGARGGSGERAGRAVGRWTGSQPASRRRRDYMGEGAGGGRRGRAEA